MNIHAMKGSAAFVPHKTLDTSLMSKSPRFWKAAVPELSLPQAPAAPVLQRRVLCFLRVSLRMLSAPCPTPVGGGKAPLTPPC